MRCFKARFCTWKFDKSIRRLTLNIHVLTYISNANKQIKIIESLCMKQILDSYMNHILEIELLV